MKKKFYRFLFLIIPALTMCACKGNDPVPADVALTEASTPVSLISVNREPIAESVELRASSLFQKKISVKSNLSGYIESMNVAIGDNVSVGQLLFTIKTKEAAALENTNVTKDTSLHFSGIIQIKAQKSGIITSVDHQKGDFVQEGDQLCTVSEPGSLVFILEVPFEVHSYLKQNSICDIVLPDDQVLKGKVTGALPSVDALSQTQSYVVKPLNDAGLPENLIARIRFVKSIKDQAVVVPRAAILSDEAQTEFWVMKVINDSTAVKIPVKKGIETTDKAEITDPVFNASDKIILNGNYGLPDTAKITILKNQ